MQSRTFSQSSSQSKKNTGIRAAKIGAALGARFGPYPYSVLIGGIAGFVIGVVADEVLDD
ncbi:hypothetical protein [Vibrio vulnificus]|uniref:hypothetical protein n=1 Tax=Vibrio vulnificus TaxID=672 RepID=UPI00165D5910|nr:hypothetical protein [Vibrio vulnificus]